MKKYEKTLSLERLKTALCTLLPNLILAMAPVWSFVSIAEANDTEPKVTFVEDQEKETELDKDH